MTEKNRKQLKNWAWFALKHGCCIWLLYQWIYQHDDGALNLLMIGFWVFAVCKLLLVLLVSEKKHIDEDDPSEIISSILLLVYGSFAAYHGAVITGAVVIVSGLLYAANCKLIREGK